MEGKFALYRKTIRRKMGGRVTYFLFFQCGSSLYMLFLTRHTSKAPAFIRCLWVDFPFPRRLRVNFYDLQCGCYDLRGLEQSIKSWVFVYLKWNQYRYDASAMPILIGSPVCLQFTGHFLSKTPDDVILLFSHESPCKIDNVSRPRVSCVSTTIAELHQKQKTVQ